MLISFGNGRRVSLRLVSGARGVRCERLPGRPTSDAARTCITPMHVCRSSQDRPSPLRAEAQLSVVWIAKQNDERNQDHRSRAREGLKSAKSQPRTSTRYIVAENTQLYTDGHPAASCRPKDLGKGLSGSLLLNDCPYVPRDLSARAPARRPGIQEIVAAGDAIDIEHLAGEEEARSHLALERVRVQL